MTGISAYLTRIELRRGRRILVLIAVLAAIVVGTVLASVAGASRSSTAFDRYLDEVDMPEAMAFGEPGGRSRLGRAQGVEATAEGELIAAFPLTDAEDFYPLMLTRDGTVPFERVRQPVVQGRFPRRSAPLEVAIGERTAERLGLAVGDTLSLATLSPQATEELNETGIFDPDGPEVGLDVVGILREPGDIAARRDDITLTFLTPAFRDAYPDDVIGALDHGTLVFLEDGHPLTSLTDAVEGADVELDTSFFTTSTSVAPTMRAIATALRLFALVVAAAGVIAILQAIARLQQLAATDDRTLDALGTTPAERRARLAAPAVLSVLVGTALGTLLAVPASALFPVGLARRAEPDPGVDVDLAVLGLGALTSAVVLAGSIYGLAHWRVRRSALAPGGVRVGRWGRAAAALGAPAPAVTGISLATHTPGRPSGVAVGGTLLSVLGVLGALVFSASVERLRADPALYGWGWDVNIEGEDLSSLEDDGDLSEALAEDGKVEAFGRLYTQLPVAIDGDPHFGTAVVPEHGDLRPVMVSGDVPTEPDEVALGRDTLRRSGADVGDVVHVGVGDATNEMRVTGIVALPVPEDGGSSAAGAFLSASSADLIDLQAECDASDSCTQTIAISLVDGADAGRWGARYLERFDDLGINVARPAPPGEVDRLTAVEHLPRYLAGFLGVLAISAVSFAAATTIRERRRDLAVLRVLGMTGRNVSTVVALLVLALTATGAAAGGVLGLVVGRLVWRWITDSVSLPYAPSLPLLAAILVPLAAIMLAQAVASSSRRTAAQIPAAMVLRAE